MNKQQLPDQVESDESSQHAEALLKERLAKIDQPNAYDYRMLASFYLNARRYEEANSVQFEMLKLASTEDNPKLLQSLYQDLGWVALLSGDPERARRHFSCQRATLEEIHEQTDSDAVYRESDLNLFVTSYRLGMWSSSRRHLGRLVSSFKGRKFGFREFVLGRQESLNSELPDFVRLRTMTALETLEQAENEQPVTDSTHSKSCMN